MRIRVVNPFYLGGEVQPEDAILDLPNAQARELMSMGKAVAEPEPEPEQQGDQGDPAAEQQGDPAAEQQGDPAAEQQGDPAPEKKGKRA